MTEKLLTGKINYNTNKNVKHKGDFQKNEVKCDIDPFEVKIEMRICLFNFCSWFFYGYQNKRNQHSNLFDNGHFCDFLVYVLFVVYFQNC